MILSTILIPLAFASYGASYTVFLGTNRTSNARASYVSDQYIRYDANVTALCGQTAPRGRYCAHSPPQNETGCAGSNPTVVAGFQQHSSTTGNLINGTFYEPGSGFIKFNDARCRPYTCNIQGTATTNTTAFSGFRCQGAP